MSLTIQRISKELFAPERKQIAAMQLGLTCLFSATVFIASYFEKAEISPQYALIGGVTSFVVSNLIDSVIKASFPGGSRSFAFRAMKAGVLAGTVAGTLHLTGIILQSYNIPFGGENAEFTMTGLNCIVPCKFM